MNITSKRSQPIFIKMIIIIITLFISHHNNNHSHEYSYKNLHLIIINMIINSISFQSWQRLKNIFMKISSNDIQNNQNYDIINKILIFFQLRTWGRRRLTSFGFLLIRLQASLLASTFGNHHHHSQSHHHHHHHHVIIVMMILLGIRCLQMWRKEPSQQGW